MEVILIQKGKVIMRYFCSPPYALVSQSLFLFFAFLSRPMYLLFCFTLDARIHSSIDLCLQIMRFCQSFINELYRYLGPDQVIWKAFCSLFDELCYHFITIVTL